MSKFKVGQQVNVRNAWKPTTGTVVSIRVVDGVELFAVRFEGSPYPYNMASYELEAVA